MPTTNEPAEIEANITAKVIDYSHRALTASPFFSELDKGGLSIETLRYVFGQYRFWRDQFHTWFGVCIVKSGSCEKPEVAEAVRSLAEHVATEMGDDHSKIYRDFLVDLGLSEAAIRGMRKAAATAKYEGSFIATFGTGPQDFADSVAALSGRELFASLRNTYVIERLATNYGLRGSQWWQLHEELEEEHFRSCLRPFIRTLLRDEREVARLLTVITGEIDRHVDYWDALLVEAREAVSAGASG